MILILQLSYFFFSMCKMFSLNIRVRHEGKQPLALVGSNFPDMKALSNAGEIANTPVKDILEQLQDVGQTVNERQIVSGGRGGHSLAALQTTATNDSNSSMNQVRVLQYMSKREYVEGNSFNAVHIFL